MPLQHHRNSYPDSDDAIRLITLVVLLVLAILVGTAFGISVAWLLSS